MKSEHPHHSSKSIRMFFIYFSLFFFSPSLFIYIHKYTCLSYSRFFSLSPWFWRSNIKAYEFPSLLNKHWICIHILSTSTQVLVRAQIQIMVGVKNGILIKVWGRKWIKTALKYSDPVWQLWTSGWILL